MRHLRFRGTLATALGALITLFIGGTGCAFVEDAAQVVLDEEMGLQRVEASATLDSGQFNKALDVLLVGLPPNEWTLGSKATWRDVRTTLCALRDADLLEAPELEVQIPVGPGSSQMRDITMQLGVVPPTAADGEEVPCGAGALSARMRVSFAPFAVDNLEEIQTQLGDNLSSLIDAVRQIRFAVGKVDFVCERGAGPEVANDMLADFHLAVVEPDIIDDPRTPFADGWLELIPFFLLDTISEETPQRFELDPDSPVTQKLKRLLRQPAETWAEQTLTMETVITIEGQALETALEGSGFAFWAQPEVVVDGLEVLVGL